MKRFPSVRWGRVPAILLATLALSAGVADASAQPVEWGNGSGLPEQTEVSEPAAGPFEQDIIRRSSEARPSPAPSTAGVSKPSAAFDLQRVLIALVAVVALIFLLKWLVRQYLGGTGFGRSSRAIEVLGRSVVSPKQQFMLVRVGRRVVVVADGGGQMNAVCEISDPQEVAEIVGQVQSERNDSITRSFGTLFGRAGQDFEQTETTAAEDGQDAPPSLATAGSAEEARDEIRGLLDKVQGLSKQFKRG